ncbi:MAG: DEAD/DEAH box helicase, partial [Burkholderiaceae bacterium]|nr:DEAD/DEAH box helicase [Burkholderiaceae bacterium]
GRYELPRRTGEAHIYRLAHPLAQWVLDRATERKLSPARLRFDYAAYDGGQLSTLKALRGQCGLLTVRLLTVAALHEEEQHLIVSGITDSGEVLPEQDAEKLLRLPASQEPPGLFGEVPAELNTDVDQRKHALLRTARERRLRFFELEVQKLDGWADDLKYGLEQRIKDVDREIKDVRRSATVAATLDEKLAWQKRQRELEAERNRLRRELFDRPDEVDQQRSDVIEQLERQLAQRVEEQILFTIEWELA